MKRRHFSAGLKAAGLGIAGFICVVPLRAQQVRDSRVVRWSDSAHPALADSARRDIGLWYPDLLRLSGVGGDVRATIVVDSAGVPDSAATVIISTAHALFADEVRRSIPWWRFVLSKDSSGERFEIPVHVTFNAPPGADAPVRDAVAIAVDSSGVSADVSWIPVPRERSAPRDTADVKWAKLQVFLLLLSQVTASDSTRPCVQWTARRGAPLPESIIRRVRLYYSDVINGDACPRDARTSTISIDAVEPWTADLLVLRASVATRSLHLRYYCESARDERGRWSANCDLRGAEP